MRRRDRALSRSERAGHHRERQAQRRRCRRAERLVGAAHFFDLPLAIGVPPRGAADYHRYTVTIDSGTCRHTVQLTEPIADPAIHRLVAFLRTQAKVFRKRGAKSDPLLPL
ncbi:MAG: protealysin inhibitor emfourin [Gammaproteobacteria bacterium]